MSTDGSWAGQTTTSLPDNQTNSRDPVDLEKPSLDDALSCSGRRRPKASSGDDSDVGYCQATRLRRKASLLKVLAHSARRGRRSARASVQYATLVTIEGLSASGMLAMASLGPQTSRISSTKPLSCFRTLIHSLTPCATALIKCRACSLQSYASVYRSKTLSLESASKQLLRTRVIWMRWR